MIEVIEPSSFMAADSKPMTKLYFEVHGYNYSLSAVIGDEFMLLSKATHQAFA